MLRFLAIIDVAILFSAGIPADSAGAERLVVTPRLHHLRIAGPREWSSFPEQPEASRLKLVFRGEASAGSATLLLRQQDVKQSWKVRLNDTALGSLVVDENDLVLALSVPAGTLREGENTLEIEQDQGAAGVDDVRVGEISLDLRPRAEVLAESRIEVTVRETQTGRPTPARITVISQTGALQTVGAASNERLAVRPGIVYTADGSAQIGLPAGQYTVFAGRGFEYSLASQTIELKAGDSQVLGLSITREVPTEGYVACDTHVHTLTHSGHGDATVEERIITIAGEGIELPIATDHNRHIDHEPFARKLGLRQYFTPVAGNEVTTTVGHFNIFPVLSGSKVPDHRPTDWESLFRGIYATPNTKVVILNHARDLHSKVRPFGPKLYNAVVAERLDGQILRANAMEVVNSGAVQSDGLQLFHDWMGQLSAGRLLTPVAASDSHDVGRHFVGQGRTYVRARDTDPGDISLDEAVNSFVSGRVLVSYGLIAELTVDHRYGPGEIAPAPGENVIVQIRVLGPGWVQADDVRLYANGQLLREQVLDRNAVRPQERGVLWQGTWELPRPKHDVHLVALALGPGIDGLYWKTAKPYQPTSPDWTGAVLGGSGAVWLDVDGDGRGTPAVDYARRLVAASGGDFETLIVSLCDYDEAVSAHCAHLWQKAGRSLLAPEVTEPLSRAAAPVRRGFEQYLEAVQEIEAARLE